MSFYVVFTIGCGTLAVGSIVMCIMGIKAIIHDIMEK